MTVKTRDFGEQEIAEDNILNFPNGVYAFEDQHRFVMLSPLGHDVFPAWLQSLDNESLCFIVFDPAQLVNGYSVTADAESAALIEKSKETSIRYLSLAVVPDEYQNTTINLKSPIMINADKMLAAQVIAAEDYPIKFPVFKKEGE